ncbi:hypothetical protein HU200_052201 [Digitaria exilis]|uniref:Uncharacterized protein n=1 Tax=Digitaria exilis TaxID=1010633 RepID=A0A835AP76_9POAL|nr:hypothetical protein HU200_052201 [Digitaria exilis]
MARGPVVLSHGYGGSQAIWDIVLPHLSRRKQVRYRCSFFDWTSRVALTPARSIKGAEHYTFSRFADELVALMDDMKLSSAVYVGRTPWRWNGRCMRHHQARPRPLLSSRPRRRISEVHELVGLRGRVRRVGHRGDAVHHLVGLPRLGRGLRASRRRHRHGLRGGGARGAEASSPWTRPWPTGWPA